MQTYPGPTPSQYSPVDADLHLDESEGNAILRIFDSVHPLFYQPAIDDFISFNIVG